MQGQGPKHADIVFVGEAPGEEEDKAGIPFIGRAGRFLKRHVFRGAGVDESEVFITNAVRCRPPNNKTPSMVEIRNCFPHLEEELKRIQPKVIVALGNVPLHSLLPIHRKKRDPEEAEDTRWKYQAAVSGITRWRGKLMWHPIFKCYVIPTFHPSALARDFNQGVQFRLKQTIADVEEAVRASHREPPKVVPVKTDYITDPGKAAEILERAIKAPFVAYDIETEGFDPNEDSLWGFSVSFEPYKGYYISWDVMNHHKSLRTLFAAFIQNSKQTKILHNVEFDDRFMQTKFSTLPPLAYPYVDTMIAASLLDENFGKGLKELVWRYLHYGGYEQEFDEWKEKHKKGWKKPDDPIEKREMEKKMSVYGSTDAACTFLLWKKFEPMLDEQDLMPLFKKVSMPVRRVMTSAEVAGFRIDLDRAKKLKQRCENAQKLLTKKMFKYAGEKFNERSPVQLSKIFYDKLNTLNDPEEYGIARNKRGFSTDATSLEILALKGKGQGKKLAQVLVDLRFINSQVSKFIDPIIKNVWDDGRIHTRYNSTGTVTGRTSCSNPGIHNVPRDKTIRSLFVASEGHQLVEADLARAELAILAAYCGDENLIKALEGDPHSEVIKMMFNKPADYKPSEDERFVGKSINFGLVYGRGPVSLAAVLGCSVEQAMEYIRLYFERLPKVKKFLELNIKRSIKRGYALSLFKRRRRLPDLKSDNVPEQRKAERQANNSVIQSAAADYTYIGLIRVAVEIAKRGLHAKIIHTVHDCVIVDAPKSEVKEVAAIVKECFERPVKAVPVRMKIDVAIVNAWGEHNDSKLGVLLDTIERKGSIGGRDDSER